MEDLVGIINLNQVFHNFYSWHGSGNETCYGKNIFKFRTTELAPAAANGAEGK